MFFELVGIFVVLYGLFHAVILSLVDCDLALAFAERFQKPISHLKGKVVFITGASSGIGEHLALWLARHGVKLVLAARRQAELQRVKAQCLINSNGKLAEEDILLLPMNVTDCHLHETFFHTAVQHFGHVDILVNNAGRSQRAAWQDIDLAVDQQMFDLNVKAVVSLTRVALHYFQQSGHAEGHVAVTSSLAGVVGLPYSGSYTGAKHCIHGYFNSLRNEKAPEELAVTLLCPGPTFTNFLQESFTAQPGEKFGIPAQPEDKRMSGERCGQLCAIALANRMPECWMGVFPIIPLAYVVVYFPNLFRIALKMIGPERLFKIRDSREFSQLTQIETI